MLIEALQQGYTMVTFAWPLAIAFAYNNAKLKLESCCVVPVRLRQPASLLASG